MQSPEGVIPYMKWGMAAATAKIKHTKNMNAPLLQSGKKILHFRRAQWPRLARGIRRLYFLRC